MVTANKALDCIKTVLPIMRKSLLTEWNVIRDAIDRIDVEVGAAGCAAPTGRMSQLLIVGEDRRFSSHPGVDPVALCRALCKTMGGSRQGGSTIAMQLVRTITGRYERTLVRKIREIALAMLLTRYKGRNHLPALYLWVAYYGWKMNGLRQAYARLGIDPRNSSEFETARLVARLKYPEPRLPTDTRTRQIEGRARHLLAIVEKESRICGNQLSGETWNHSE